MTRSDVSLCKETQTYQMARYNSNIQLETPGKDNQCNQFVAENTSNNIQLPEPLDLL